MEVLQPQGSDNYALVGAGKTAHFSIGQNASAFRIMSDTLYSDKKLAVVREIICNAHDAHIEAGIDAPIEIFTKNSEFVVKDHGKGIPEDQVVENYTTYFNSTKQLDGRVTGGFGLGTKAPFAYSDHFIVENSIGGTRTIYAAHIGDETTGGAPGFAKMTSRACTNSGMTVRVPIMDREDMNTFTELTKNFVKYAGIAVKLDGEMLETLDYTEIEKESIGFLDNRLGYQTVMVKIGAVLYPVTGEATNIFGHKRLMEISSTVRKTIVLIAPPSILSITPSRESLAYNDATMNWLKDQFGIFESNNDKIMKKMTRTLYVNFLRTCNRNNYYGRAGHYFQDWATMEVVEKIVDDEKIEPQILTEYYKQKMRTTTTIINGYPSEKLKMMRKYGHLVFRDHWKRGTDPDEAYGYWTRTIGKLAAKHGIPIKSVRVVTSSRQYKFLSQSFNNISRCNLDSWKNGMIVEITNRISDMKENGIGVSVAGVPGHNVDAFIEALTKRNFNVIKNRVTLTRKTPVKTGVSSEGFHMLELNKAVIRREKALTQIRLTDKPETTRPLFFVELGRVNEKQYNSLTFLYEDVVNGRTKSHNFSQASHFLENIRDIVAPEVAIAAALNQTDIAKLRKMGVPSYDEFLASYIADTLDPKTPMGLILIACIRNLSHFNLGGTTHRLDSDGITKIPVMLRSVYYLLSVNEPEAPLFFGSMFNQWSSDDVPHILDELRRVGRAINICITDVVGSEQHVRDDVMRVLNTCFPEKFRDRGVKAKGADLTKKQEEKIAKITSSMEKPKVGLLKYVESRMFNQLIKKEPEVIMEYMRFLNKRKKS